MKTRDHIMIEMMQIMLQNILKVTPIEHQVNSKEKRNWQLYNKLDELNKIRYRIFEIDSYTLPIWLEKLHKEFENE